MDDIQEKADAINAFANLIKTKDFEAAAIEYYSQVQFHTIDGILKSYNIIINKYKKRKDFDDAYSKYASDKDGYIDQP